MENVLDDQDGLKLFSEEADLQQYDEFLQKSYSDSSQSLLEEKETKFLSLDRRRIPDFSGQGKSSDVDNAIRTHHTMLTKTERKKYYGNHYHSGLPKLMSVHDEKTLDTAVAMANEITTKSMDDLGCDNNLPSSSQERHKFHFKFKSLHHHHHRESHNAEKETTSSKQERRNFSEEVQSVPDIQESITEQSKQAYTSLIEQPSLSSTLISEIASSTAGHCNHFQTQQRHPSFNRYPSMTENNNAEQVVNVLPLPPRSSKTKLVDKPRHVRKYPLKLPNTMNVTSATEMSAGQSLKPIIYQNTVSCQIMRGLQTNGTIES